MEVKNNGQNNFQKRVMDIMVANLDSEIAKNLSLETSLLIDGIDSITFIKIVVELEKEFNFEFDDEMLSIAAFSTIMSIIEYVEIKGTC
jgi:acyl carrier protein